MFVIIILILIMIYVYIQTCNNDQRNQGNQEKQENFWYYPNCMETAFGGKRCYPNYYPNRFYYPLFPWFYSDDYYYPYTTAPY